MTIRWSNIEEDAQTDFGFLYENSIVKVETNAELPAFVQQFDQDLLLPRSPELGVSSCSALCCGPTNSEPL